MSTKLIIITARSQIGWSPLGSDKPTEKGTIATIHLPSSPVQWFVRRRASRNVNWWPIMSTAQVSPNGFIHGAISTPEGIQEDILSFLMNFNIQVSYEIPIEVYSKGKPKKTRSLRLSDRAWENIQKAGGASMVEEWALKL